MSSIYLSSTDDSILHLFFYYLMNLNIMTVKTKVSSSTDVSTAISAGWVSPQRLSVLVGRLLSNTYKNSSEINSLRLLVM